MDQVVHKLENWFFGTEDVKQGKVNQVTERKGFKKPAASFDVNAAKVAKVKK